MSGPGRFVPLVTHHSLLITNRSAGSDPGVVRRGQLAAGVAGVDRPGRLDEHEFALVLRERLVLLAPRDDEHFAGTQTYAAVPKLDRQLPLDDQEDLVRVGVAVPDEIALCPSEL